MQSEQTSESRPQEKFGRYQQIKRIGRGGMGEVWLCEDTLLHRQVAIKTLPSHNQQDQGYVASFEREAQAIAALNHPHVLSVHDYGSQPLPHGKLMTYLVMPYVAGGSLADVIKQLASKRQGIEQDKALLFLSQAADAIDYAHTQGIVHRDIKPANMLLHADDWLLLSDFGVVRIVSSSDDLAEEGVIVGTPIYIAPEQARGHAEAASDIYSLAVIAYQFFVGRPPFKAETSLATIMQHVLQPPPDPCQFHPDLPSACEEVLLRGLAKTPAERYPSARAFVDELKRSLGVAVSEPLQTVRQVERSGPATRRKVLIGAATGLVAIGTGTSLWALAASRSTPPASQPSPRAEEPAMVLREHLAPASTLTWVPNRNVLTSAGDDDTIKLWDIDSFRYRQQPEYESTKSINLQGTYARLAWSQDGQYLAVANAHLDATSFNSSIDIYQADLNKLVSGFEQGIAVTQMGLWYGLNWLQNSLLVALWDAADSGSVDSTGDMIKAYYLGMWDITQPAQYPRPLLKEGMVTINVSVDNEQSLPITPNGWQAAIATEGGILTGTLKIVNNEVTWLPSRDALRTSKDDAYTFVGSLSWGSGGQLIMGIADIGDLNTIVGWDLAGQPDELLRFGMPFDALNFTTLATHPSATNKMFAAGTENGEIYLWSGETRKLPVRTLASSDISAKVLALAWSPDGEWLAASYQDADATILIWKV